MQQKRYDEAIAYFHQALTVTPNYMDPHMNLGTIYSAMDLLDDADREFTRHAVALDPFSFIPLATPTRTFSWITAAPRKLSNSSRGRLEADDNSWTADQNLGDLYLAEADTVRARQAYRAALALDRFNTKAHFGLAAADERRWPYSERHARIPHAGLDTDPLNTVALDAVRRISAQFANH